MQVTADLQEGVEPKPPVACDKCAKPMVVKTAGSGYMLACTGYPWCEHTRDLPTPEAAAAACQNCGKAMVLKRGRFGEFLSCTGYPACKTTRKVAATGQQPVVSKPDQVLDEPCPQCQSNLVVKHGRFGEFTACSNYPSCKYVKQKSTGLACPKDNGDVIERKSRQGKVFFGCANYPACDFVLWNRPVLEACPQCGEPFLVEKITKRHGRQLVCHKDDCDYARSEPLAPA